jgi:glutaredoxin 3
MSVIMYTTRFCPYCIRARQLFESKGINFRDIAIDRDPALRTEMVEKSRRHTVPQIWVGNEHIGGCDELYALEREQKLDPLLASVT